MFGWLKANRPTASEGAARFVREIEERAQREHALLVVVDAYGALLERYPGLYIDAKRLPLPKNEMKAVLRGAWSLKSDPQWRKAVEIGYVSLRRFQEGIGDDPVGDLGSGHAGELPAFGRGTKVLENMKARQAWDAKTADEARTLMAELESFGR